MTKIEWVKSPDNSQGITVNSKTGCRNHTPEGLCLGGLFPCYAYKLANTRLKERYLANGLVACDYDGGEEGSDADLKAAFADPFYPRWWPERLDKIRGIKKPTGIFLDDMSDWMWKGWPEKWTRMELQVMRDCPQHRFYTLTKQPQNLSPWNPFPENCWVGVTATNPQMFYEAQIYLEKVTATVRYISLEPYLTQIVCPAICPAIDWLIIGQQTPVSVKAQPKIEWLRDMVKAVDRAEILAFLKNNLRPLLIPEDCTKPNCLMDDIFWASEKAQLRQEIPTVS